MHSAGKRRRPRVHLAAYRVGLLPWSITQACGTLGEPGTDWDNETKALSQLLTSLKQEVDCLAATGTRRWIDRIHNMAAEIEQKSGDPGIQTKSESAYNEAVEHWESKAKSSAIRGGCDEAIAYKHCLFHRRMRYIPRHGPMSRACVDIQTQRDIAAFWGRSEGRVAVTHVFGTDSLFASVQALADCLGDDLRPTYEMGSALGDCVWRCWLPELASFVEHPIPREAWASLQQPHAGVDVPGPSDVCAQYRRERRSPNAPEWRTFLPSVLGKIRERTESWIKKGADLVSEERPLPVRHQVCAPDDPGGAHGQRSNEQPSLTQDRLAALRKLKKQLDPQGRFIGESHVVLQMFGELDRLLKISKKPVPITLLGEKGSGKTYLARVIHDASLRATPKPAETKHGHPDNLGICSAADFMGLDLNLPKGKLTGYGEGHGISGVKDNQTGLLEDHRGGTLLIDEFLDLSLEIQIFLLGVLNNDPVQKIGKGVVRPPFPRFVFAANKDPDECIKEGTLRGDFWDRINQGIIHVPQLRERPDDIPYFLKKWSKEPDLRTWLALLEYTWPGNVRELERTMERIPSEQVRLEDLPAVLQGQFGAMDEGGIEQRLLKLLVGFLQSQGYAKGKKGAALNQRVAEIIGRSEAWVSEKLKVYNLP